MGIFGTNYSTPGPGINKNTPKKKGLRLFYDILFRKFWDLIQLNILYIATLLPTFAIVFVLSGMISNAVGITSENLMKLGEQMGYTLTAVDAARTEISSDLMIRMIVSVCFTILWGGGPVTAGFVYILRSMIWENPVFLATDYFAHVKSNFKQSLIVYIIDLIVFTVICYAYYFYGSRPSILFCLKYVILVLAFIYTIAHFFIYHMLVTYKLTIGKLFKNAALFAISSLPWCALVTFVVLFLIFIFPAIGFTAYFTKLAVVFMILSFIVLFALIFSVCGLIIEINTVEQIEKYIKEDADVERNE